MLAKAWQTREQRTPIQIDFVSIGDVHCTHVEKSKYWGNGVNSIESPINCAWKGWSTLQTKASYTNYHQQKQDQLKPPKSNTKHIRVNTLPILAEKPKHCVSRVAGVKTILLETIAHQGDMRSCKECVTWCIVVKDNGTSHKRRSLVLTALCTEAAWKIARNSRHEAPLTQKYQDTNFWISTFLGLNQALLSCFEYYIFHLTPYSAPKVKFCLKRKIL